MMTSLKVSEIFDLTQKTNSSKLTKAFVNQNSGDIPVYGASADPKQVGYGYIKDNLDSIKYFEDCLTWNIDGSMCVVHKRVGRFSLSEKVIPLIMFEKWQGKLSEDFLKVAIESEAKSCGFGFGHKAGKTKLGEIEVQVPTLEDGNFNVDAQEKLVHKHVKINNLQSELKQSYEFVSFSLVQLDDEYEKKQITLNTELNDKPLFQLEIGKRVLKKDVLSNGIPLFSANVFKPFGYIEKTNLVDFSRPSIIWGIDGIFDWNYIDAGIVFATTDHCGRLTVIEPTLNPKYIWYQLRLTASQYGFNRVFRSSLKNLEEYVSIEIPVTKSGKYDLEAQNEIEKRYEAVNRIKDSLCDILQQGALSNVAL